jgi:rfaE bifunctional protein kinase chain/domain
MTRERLEELLQQIRSARIGVIGDFCVDAYWTIDPSLSEISVETGLPTRAVRLQRYSAGGAGNVANNLLSMGVTHVKAFGIAGSDLFGREMLRILGAAGVDTRGILMQEHGWDTPVYVKPVQGEEEQNRIDLGRANTLHGDAARELREALDSALEALDLVIINQQLMNGVHTEELRKELAALISRASIPFLCDSRCFSDSYPGAIRKLNDREALRLCGERGDAAEPVPLGAAARAVDALFGRWNAPVFLTRGARGILVRDARGAHEVPGLHILGSTDAVGAGDSATAGIAAALAAGADIMEAAELGNFAAGVSVQKLFTTGAATPAEIIAIGADPAYVYRPELAEDSRSARYHGDSGIEIVSAPRPASPVTHALFDNDGTLSVLREGWDAAMESMMARAILGDSPERADEKLRRRVQERVREYVDTSTGTQTLAQMQGLVELVREFGLVPDADVKSAQGYKLLYSKELSALASRRIATLERGELGAESFVLEGAPAMLKALHAAGVKLFLASGADESFVRADAKALGYAAFFAGRIHGSVGDLKADAKTMVLETILAELGPSRAGHLVTFGDGPVEIRETKKRGGFAIGVASDELRRSGWNWSKRTRLIKAGADLVVPDYSRWKTLIELLGVRA